MRFCSEGDNVADACDLANHLAAFVDLIEIPKYQWNESKKNKETKERETISPLV